MAFRDHADKCQPQAGAVGQDDDHNPVQAGFDAVFFTEFGVFIRCSAVHCHLFADRFARTEFGAVFEPGNRNAQHQARLPSPRNKR